MTPSTNSRKQRLSLAPMALRAINPVPARKDGKPEVSSDHLFSGSREIHILHKDDIYRLSITKQGKLILTK